MLVYILYMSTCVFIHACVYTICYVEMTFYDIKAFFFQRVCICCVSFYVWCFRNLNVQKSLIIITMYMYMCVCLCTRECKDLARTYRVRTPRVSTFNKNPSTAGDNLRKHYTLRLTAKQQNPGHIGFHCMHRPRSSNGHMLLNARISVLRGRDESCAASVNVLCCT